MEDVLQHNTRNMNVFKQYNISQVNLLFSGLICISLGYCLVKLQLPHLESVKQAGLATDQYLKVVETEKLQLEFLTNAPTFGFDNLVASKSMLQFLQYLGDGDARKQTGYSISYKYLEVIAKKDPRFTQAYLIISPASSIFGGTPHKTIKIMDQGLQKLTPDIPKSYFVWLYKGVDEVLFLGDLKKAQESYEKAAEWAKIAGDERIEQAARNTAQFLATNPDLTQAQVGAWFTVFSSNANEQLRELARRRIEQLGGTIEVFPNGNVVATPPQASK